MSDRRLGSVKAKNGALLKYCNYPNCPKYNVPMLTNASKHMKTVHNITDRAEMKKYYKYVVADDLHTVDGGNISDSSEALSSSKISEQIG